MSVTNLLQGRRSRFKLKRNLCSFVVPKITLQYYNIHDTGKLANSNSILRETKTISEFEVEPGTNHPIKTTTRSREFASNIHATMNATNQPQCDFVPKYVTTTICDYHLTDDEKAYKNIDMDLSTHPVAKETQSTFEYNNQKGDNNEKGDNMEWLNYVPDDFNLETMPELFEDIKDKYFPIETIEDIEKVLSEYNLFNLHKEDPDNCQPLLCDYEEDYMQIVMTNLHEDKIDIGSEQNPFTWIYAMINDCKQGETIKIATFTAGDIVVCHM